MTLLLEAQEEVNAYHKRTWQRVKEQILTEMLWKNDGLLRLQVYPVRGPGPHATRCGAVSESPRLNHGGAGYASDGLPQGAC